MFKHVFPRSARSGPVLRVPCCHPCFSRSGQSCRDFCLAGKMLVQPHRQWCWISLNRAYMCFGHALKLVHALCVPVLTSARAVGTDCCGWLLQLQDLLQPSTCFCGTTYDCYSCSSKKRLLGWAVQYTGLVNHIVYGHYCYLFVAQLKEGNCHALDVFIDNSGFIRIRAPNGFS